MLILINIFLNFVEGVLFTIIIYKSLAYNYFCKINNIKHKDQLIKFYYYSLLLKNNFYFLIFIICEFVSQS